MTTSNTETIFIPLLDEGTLAARPTQAIRITEHVYRVLPTPNYDPEIEKWQFSPGNMVRCSAEV
jgi:hypothetical protein